MGTFREHKSIVDRSAADRVRHKKKIEKAIKESSNDVIAEESIIGQNGKKKIRIPVRGIKEYRFVYGNNEKNQAERHTQCKSTFLYHHTQRSTNDNKYNAGKRDRKLLV